MIQAFREINFSEKRLEQLHRVNDIIETYREDYGLSLSLRQLYYQLVSRNIIPNSVNEYKKLGDLIADGRMCGIVDWEAIEDRLRKPEKPTEWESPQQICQAAYSSYRVERWKGQPWYLEVWVEKDALSSVIEQATEKYGIHLMVNRGYGSVSAMYQAYKRIEEEIIENTRPVKILYVGDFDPSGLDMIRDVKDRITEMLINSDDIRQHGENLGYSYDYPEDWIGHSFDVQPIALDQYQIRLYNPPPNPAKESDSRSKPFIQKYGVYSWEVDALPPDVLQNTVKSAIEEHIDWDIFNAGLRREVGEKDQIFRLIQKLGKEDK